MNTQGAYIRRLKISRFRGVKDLSWLPSPGLNLILGGGDAGKTTLLEAIALLLNPANSAVVSDADYFAREIDKEFVIHAVISVPSAVVSQQAKMAWPWEWDGKEPQLPKLEEAAEAKPQDPVYCVRVRGTGEADLLYEIEQPDGSIDLLPAAVRRAIGLVRLGEDRNDRDLRLVYGSALDRLLDDKTLRARLAVGLGKDDLSGDLLPSGTSALAALNTAFKAEALPTDLGIGLTGGPGLSLGALIGLTAKKEGVMLPLATWGAGTRRLAALAIASSLQTDHPIMVVDELERGLEPYRQRQLVAKLEKSACQVFATTHSVPALRATPSATLWYVDAKGSIAALQGEGISRLRTQAGEALLSRITVVMEGATELGFAGVFIRRAFKGAELAHGVWCADGQGNDQTLELLENLSAGGLMFGGFADDEGRNAGRWAVLKARLGPLLFRWAKGALEDNVVPLFKGKLDQLIEDPEGERTGRRYRSLAIRLGIKDKDMASLLAKAGSEENLMSIVIEAAKGHVPKAVPDPDRKSWERHARDWFKSVQGGQELALKVVKHGLAAGLEPQFVPFLNAVRDSVGQTPITKL